MAAEREVAAKFAKIGAEAKITSIRYGLGFLVNVNKQTGQFSITKPRDVALEVLDFDTADRHLLLMTRPANARFLCGHDERHWFVAAIPESTPAATVEGAKEALKPTAVLQAEQRLGTWAKKRRRNPARIRQGEWFFLPAPGFKPPLGMAILRKEPLGRVANGRFISQPHIVDELVRFGGDRVYIPRLPRRELREEDREVLRQEIGTGLTEKQRKAYLERHREARSWRWDSYIRNPEVFARGQIRHADHRTVHLRGWHRVLQNTETQARAMSSVAFVD